MAGRLPFDGASMSLFGMWSCSCPPNYVPHDHRDGVPAVLRYVWPADCLSTRHAWSTSMRPSTCPRCVRRNFFYWHDAEALLDGAASARQCCATARRAVQ